MKILKTIIIILFFQSFNYCYSQGLGAGMTTLSSIPRKTEDIIVTGLFSGACVTVSVINGINFFHHKPASSNAPFGIILGIFQIAVFSQLPSDEKTIKTINIISGGCLIATSTLRLYTFKKDSTTAFNLNILPSNHGLFLVGLQFSHTFN